MILHKSAECSKNNYWKKLLGLFCLVLLTANCATSTPDHLKEYARDPSKKIQLRAFFPEGPVFNIDHIFRKGSVDKYDVRIIARSKDLSSRKKSLKTKGKKGQYQSEASFFVENTVVVIITDVSGRELVTVTKRGSAVGETGAWPGFGLEKEVSERRAEKNAIKDGVSKIVKSVEASVLAEVLDSPAIRNLERKGGLQGLVKKDKTLFENIHILISDRIKRGMTDDKTDNYAKDLAKSIKEVFRKRFRNVEIISGYKQVRENQIILQPLSLIIGESDFGDAYYGKGGHVDIKAEMEVITFRDSRTFSFHGSGNYSETFLTAFPQQILGVATLFTYSRIQSKMYNSVAGKKARNIIAYELLNRILHEPYYADLIQDVEKEQIFSHKKDSEDNLGMNQYHARIISSKMPFTCILSLPPHIDDIKAKAYFNRAFHINYEKQSGTTEADIGTQLKEVLLVELKKRCADVQLPAAADNDHSMSYNPYDIKLVIDIEYRDTQVKYKPDPVVTLDASANIKTAIGAIYKKIDITSQRPISLGKGSGALAGVLSGLSITRALTEGAFIKKAFKNGCESAVKDAVWKIMDEFDGSFIKEFSEFSAYDSAVKSKSLSDIQHFLAVYPDSKYANELTEIMDGLMYDFATSADTIEPFVDYLNAMPKGKHRGEILNRLEHMLFAEIKNGNEQFCSMYIEFLPMGENIDEVEKFCQIP